MKSGEKTGDRYVVWRDVSENGKPDRVSYIAETAAVVHVLKVINEKTVSYHSSKLGDEGKPAEVVKFMENLTEFEVDMITLKKEELREKYPKMQLYEQ